MQYYEVLVGDVQFHGNKALTYGYDGIVKRGTIVKVALRGRTVLGITKGVVPKPDFAAKAITEVVATDTVPEEVFECIAWLEQYYPAPLGSIVRQFLPPTTSRSRKQSTPASTPQHESARELSLTADQQKAISQVGSTGSYLLHGITGSGKTRVYQALAAKTLENGRSVIVLTPEIGLTEHIAKEMKALPFHSIVLHSRLTNAKRRDLWYEILAAKEPIIIIGPRSALFAPVHNVGLIIMDEAHDQAYKNDSSPHYRTDRAAALLGHLHGAAFVAGTATPNIEDYYMFVSKDRPIIELNQLAMSSKKELKTQIVTMSDTANIGRSRILSTPLIAAITDALVRKEQVLLFLNRRGTASVILCTVCGWRAMCPHCDLPLTYHADIHALRCHTCGRTIIPPTSCPDCDNNDVVLKSIGTKAVVDEVHRFFPTAKLRRFDTDTANVDQLETQLVDLYEGAVDIIIGTQMIAKGLDLPKLSVVGIINADSGLMVPDYTASERTYQLISQVVGRIGRGHRPGTIILQTYRPESPILQDAVTQNYKDFYEKELRERQLYYFPPFCFIARLTCTRASSSSAQRAATALKEQLEREHPTVRVEGPSPTFHPKENGKYKWQLVLKSPSRTKLTTIICSLPSGWYHDIDPVNLL